MEQRGIHTVVARREATKQSPARDARTERPFAGDCFVATLLAMTVVGWADLRFGDGGYYAGFRFQPSQSHTPWPITNSRSFPFSQGNSSVNIVTHCR